MNVQHGYPPTASGARKCPRLAALGSICVAGASTFLVTAPASAQDGGGSASQLTSFLVLGALALVPILFMTFTSFVKLSVVFSILRNALGAGEIPSGAVITALSLVLTLYVMAPVGEDMIDAAAPSATRVSMDAPLRDTESLVETIRAGGAPLVAFLHRNAGERELGLFYDLARDARPPDRRDRVGRDDALVVAPAFLVTELGEAFQIGFLIFLPFLVVDLVIANVLTALGLTSLNPTQVSMPFKLLLFVMVDGWYLLARALVLGYATT